MTRFKNWLFRWVRDNDGDIALCVAGCVVLTKYKDTTLITWGKCEYAPAERYVR